MKKQDLIEQRYEVVDSLFNDDPKDDLNDYLLKCLDLSELNKQINSFED